MSSNVYFTDLRTTFQDNLFTKIGRLLDNAGLAETVRARDLVAVKLHFGEMGNAAFIRPVFLRRIVKAIKEKGGNPFLTDANTLYAGTRSDAPSHLATALANGFAPSVVEAPLIIADGLRGKSETEVTIGQKHFQSVHIAREIFEADSLVAVAHFKGHELSGFGGAIKNLGMGCASRRGKMAQHATMTPKVKAKSCVGCGACAAHCSQGAITIPDKAAVIDPAKCIGCGECVIVCPNEAVQVRWTQSIPKFIEKIVEYASGAVKNKAGKMLFLNFLTHISPGCDCAPTNDMPIVADIGILAATDPVAIDQASVDLVNAQAALPGSCLQKNTGPGEDKFRGLYPKVDGSIQLAYAEAIGLGKRAYTLKKV